MKNQETSIATMAQQRLPETHWRLTNVYREPKWPLYGERWVKQVGGVTAIIDPGYRIWRCSDESVVSTIRTTPGPQYKEETHYHTNYADARSFCDTRLEQIAKQNP